MHPVWRQTWLNLQVWVPVLANPPLKRREVRYWAREARVGTTWQIALPSACWQCGTREGLTQREFDLGRSAFEQPLIFVAGSVAVCAFFLAWATLFGSWWALLLAVLAACGGIGLIRLKSWTERVRLVLSTCTEHAADLKCPEFVLDQNELFLFLPTEQLAELTRVELQAERRGRARGGYSAEMDSGTAAGRPQSEHPRSVRDRDVPADDSAPVYRPRLPSRPPVDLPPIKLAGDDEDSSSAPNNGP